uniref:Uncharacterized protein n=1 Tax=Mustela putorius furo TaxID=9669 RepID=M3YV05_MUSPF
RDGGRGEPRLPGRTEEGGGAAHTKAGPLPDTGTRGPRLPDDTPGRESWHCNPGRPPWAQHPLLLAPSSISASNVIRLFLRIPTIPILFCCSLAPISPHSSGTGFIKVSNPRHHSMFMIISCPYMFSTREGELGSWCLF